MCTEEETNLRKRMAAMVLAMSIGVGVGVTVVKVAQPRETKPVAMWISHMSVYDA